MLVHVRDSKHVLEYAWTCQCPCIDTELTWDTVKYSSISFYLQKHSKCSSGKNGRFISMSWLSHQETEPDGSWSTNLMKLLCICCLRTRSAIRLRRTRTLHAPLSDFELIKNIIHFKFQSIALHRCAWHIIRSAADFFFFVLLYLNNFFSSFRERFSA